MLPVALVLLQASGSWAQALEAEDYRAAWQAASALEGEAERARAEACIFYQAGDPARAWRAAQRGLAVAPEDLELHFYTTGSALWLGEPEAAQAAAAAMNEAALRASLSAEDREAWLRTGREFADQAEAIALAEQARARALDLARAGATTGMLAALAALLVLARGVNRASGATH